MPDPLTPEELAELRRLEAEDTPGSWRKYAFPCLLAEIERLRESYRQTIKALNVALFHLDNPEVRKAEGEEDIDGARAVLRIGLEQRAALAQQEAPDA